jgi:iron complex outermembrane receptor protein
MSTRNSLIRVRACGIAARCAAWLIVLILVPGQVYPASAPPAGDSDDIMELSLEELMDIEVTSVSKKGEKLAEAAAAVYVITADDIRRSGCRYLPDLLRMVPGVHVAQIDASQFVVSARGFSGNFANKLLVLVDGRSVYTSLFSGVHWDIQDIPFESIDRIEVIRGPGATLWGANAVNGVINIITKPASSEQPLRQVQGGFGTKENGFGSALYGGRLGDKAAYRVYARYFDRPHLVDSTGQRSNDENTVSRAGLRLDMRPSSRTTLTLHGDLYTGHNAQTSIFPEITPPYQLVSAYDTPFSGGNIVGLWSQQLRGNSQAAIQVYFDSHSRDGDYYQGRVTTFDLEAQHQVPIRRWLDAIWGVGYRRIRDRMDSTAFLHAAAVTQNTDLFSAFVQSTVSSRKDNVRFTIGSKFEHNQYTGFELQPSARLAWLPTQTQTLWAAVSRAVRTPARVENDVRVPAYVVPPLSASNPTALPMVATLWGSPRYGSETLLAYEAGYRCAVKRNATVDLAAFFNEYENLRSLSIGIPYPNSTAPTYMVLPLRTSNNMRGHVYGAELTTVWQVRHWWEVTAAYSYLKMDLQWLPGTPELTFGGVEGDSPEHQFSVHNALNLPHNVELDTYVRFVGALPHLGVDQYTTFDVRLGWMPVPKLTVELVGRNLVDGSHTEFKPELNNVYTQAERSVYSAITWGF